MVTHVVLDASGSGGVCRHCGETVTFPEPMLLERFVARCRVFVAVHRECQPKPSAAEESRGGCRWAEERPDDLDV